MFELERALNRLHHLSMRYSGAILELVSREPLGLITQGHPGLKETRDLIDLMLFTRAEMNALTACLIETGSLNRERYEKQLVEEYSWLTEQKARFLGVGVSDAGLVIKRK